MIQTTLIAMLKRKIGNYNGHYIYIIREGDVVFYIGRSLDPLGRLVEHLYGGRSGISHLGHFIRNNAEAADNWQVELLTLDDCKPYVDQYRTFTGDEEEWKKGYVYNGRRDKYWQNEAIAAAESALIQHYHPCLNVAGNPYHSPLPAQYRPDFLYNLGLEEE